MTRATKSKTFCLAYSFLVVFVLCLCCMCCVTNPNSPRMLLFVVDYVRASLPPSAVAYAYTMKDAKVHLEKGLVCGQSLSFISFFLSPPFTSKCFFFYVPIKVLLQNLLNTLNNECLY